MINPDSSGVPQRGSLVAASRSDPASTAEAQDPPQAAHNGLAPADLPVLLGAVGGRLRELAQEPEAEPLLECADALAQLQEGMTHELRRRRQLELALFDTQVYLAQARADLAGSRDGARRARYQALHDGLTDLPNRRYFGQRLAQAIQEARPEQPAVAVLYLDLDNFKQVNDEHGHAVGDEVLKIAAARLRRAVRASDMVSRIGGDEFACLRATDADPRPLLLLANKLYQAVSAPMTVGALSLQIQPSIGIAVFPFDGACAESLLKSADMAMYTAKRARLGHAFHDTQAGG
ncbi:GGDEF domain-containing protein [Paucibacter soli]|uniref:GGDEF domain-containing protein n=1 Tax=Paucibacter soli TaxID=3133433 RepID=UPI0030B3F1A2